MDELSPANPSEMVIPKFDGEIDAYWWVLCTEKYFKHWGTPEKYKMIVAGFAMKGPPLTWWLRWYPQHRWVNWDAFTSIFLWHFKPEWRVILPVPDDEENLEIEPPQLVQGGNIDEQPTVVDEGINDSNQISSSPVVSDLDIAIPINDSLVLAKSPVNNESIPLLFEPENQDGDNKIQSYELVTEGLDTVPVVADEQNDMITTVSKDRDVRLDFDVIFSVPNLVRSSCFTLAFAQAFAVPSKKATMNTTSTTSPQHLVLLFDPGGYFDLQESWTTNRVLPLPPKPPDRSCDSVSVPWYVQVLNQIPYMLQYGGHFNFYTFSIASSIYISLHKLCLKYHVDGLACYENTWKSEVYHDSKCEIYLINFYANVGVYSAQKVFAEMSGQSVGSWLTFILGVLINTYGWEVYTSLSLDLCKTSAFRDASKDCIFSDYSQAWSSIKCAHKCLCKIPLQYENNHQVGLLKKLGLKVPTIASTDELGWVHDHHLLVFSPKHTQSKLIKNVDLMQPLYFAKEGIVLVTFLVNGARLLGYHSIGSIDKAMQIMLTLTCSHTLCSNYLRLMSFSNDIVQYYQVSIIGFEEYKPNLLPIIGDYIASSTVHSIRLGSFIHNYPNSNLLHNVWLAILIGSLEGQCNVAVLVPWKGLTPTSLSYEDQEYWKIFYNLEDKVGIHGGDSDIIHVVWVPCMLAWMCHNEETICDTKAVEMMEKINHRKIVRLWSGYILLDGNLEAKLATFVLTKIDNLVTTWGEFMHIIVESYDYTKPVRMQNGHQWDPGGHLRNYTAVMWSPFKQWDPGKICVVSNFYNLEDKVDFKGESIVMSLLKWIGPNKSELTLAQEIKYQSMS